MRARVWRELGGVDLAVPPGLALADLALRARRMRAEVLVQEGGWVTQHALPAAGCATRHARLGEAVGGLRLGAGLEARWGAELRAALFRGADALPTTTVLWNMECGDGATLGLTTEEVPPPPPPSPRTNGTRLVPPPVLTGHVSGMHQSPAAPRTITSARGDRHRRLAPRPPAPRPLPLSARRSLRR